MDNALLVGFNDIGRQEQTVRDITADLACHIVTLDAVYNRVLVGIFLHNFLVVAFEKGEYAVVRGVCLTDERTGVTVSYIAARNVECALCHDLTLDHILNFLDRNGSSHLAALIFDIVGNVCDLTLCKLVLIARVVSLCDSVNDLIDVKNLFRSVSFDDLHFWSSLFLTFSFFLAELFISFISNLSK